MSRRRSVLAIVVHWTRADLTRACVEALAASTLRPEMLVVDNGSACADLARIVTSVPGVSLLTLPHNLGFTGGMNAGIAWALDAGFDSLWLLNDDAIVRTDACEALADVAARHAPGAWSATLIDEAGRPGHVGGRVGLRGEALTYRLADDFDTSGDGLPWLTGTALFAAADVFRRVGSFDERYFAYWEDVDWSVRASRAGIRLGVCRDAVVEHRQQIAQTARAAQRYFLTSRNELLFARAHVRPADWAHVLPRVAARQIRLAAWLDRRGARELARAVLTGGWSGFRGRTGAPRAVWMRDSVADGLLARPLAWSQRFDRVAAASPIDTLNERRHVEAS
jgi:GT2 family glycosyltransferase